jgi:hypothetical protein
MKSVDIFILDFALAPHGWQNLTLSFTQGALIPEKVDRPLR